MKAYKLKDVSHSPEFRDILSKIPLKYESFNHNNLNKVSTNKMIYDITCASDIAREMILISDDIVRIKYHN